MGQTAVTLTEGETVKAVRLLGSPKIAEAQRLARRAFEMAAAMEQERYRVGFGTSSSSSPRNSASSNRAPRMMPSNE